MKITFTLAVAGALLTGPISCPLARADGGDPSVVRDVNRIQELLDYLEAARLAGRFRDEVDCRRHLTVAGLVKSARNEAMIDDLGGDMNYVAQYAYRYYTCQAYAKGGDQV